MNYDQEEYKQSLFRQGYAQGNRDGLDGRYTWFIVGLGVGAGIVHLLMGLL